MTENSYGRCKALDMTVVITSQQTNKHSIHPSRASPSVSCQQNHHGARGVTNTDTHTTDVDDNSGTLSKATNADTHTTHVDDNSGMLSKATNADTHTTHVDDNSQSTLVRYLGQQTQIHTLPM